MVIEIKLVSRLCYFKIIDIFLFYWFNIIERFRIGCYLVFKSFVVVCLVWLKGLI